MTVYVVDASVGAKWWFPEVHHEPARRVRDPGHDLHAPGLFDLEIASVVCKRIRTGTIALPEGRQILAALERVPVRRHTDRDLLHPAVTLAQATMQSVYDCLYLALALLIDGQLITADARFYRALRSSPVAEALIWVEDVE